MTKEKPDPRMAQHAATMCANEIFPRWKKYGSRIDPAFVRLLVELEIDGVIQRHQTRRILDAAFAEAAGGTS